MLDLDLYLSVSVNARYILHTQTLRFIYNKILVWVSLSSTLTLLMTRDGIYNANSHSNNNAMNPPPLDLLLAMQTQLLETLVRMQ
jgi:hypothetical protein